MSLFSEAACWEVVWFQFQVEQHADWYPRASSSKPKGWKENAYLGYQMFWPNGEVLGQVLADVNRQRNELLKKLDERIQAAYAECAEKARNWELKSTWWD